MGISRNGSQFLTQRETENETVSPHVWQRQGGIRQSPNSRARSRRRRGSPARIRSQLPNCKKKEGDYSVRTLEKRWNVLGETIKLTVLNLPTVIPVFDGISRGTAVVEILVLVDVGVIVVRET